MVDSPVFGLKIKWGSFVFVSRTKVFVCRNGNGWIINVREFFGDDILSDVLAHIIQSQK
jgi:hypothetical protein